MKVCSDPSGTIEVTSQAELDDLAGCEVVEGQLAIQGDAITDLRPLGALRLVTDELTFSQCENLDSFDGLVKLEHIGSFYISGSPNLESFQGLDSLRSIGGGAENNRLGIGDNAGLVSVSELAGVSVNVADVELTSPALASLDGLPHFKSLRSVRISTAATEVLVFSTLERCDSIVVMYNPSLTTLDLNALSEVGELDVSDNPSLSEFGLDALETGTVHLAGSLLERFELPNLLTATHLSIQGNEALLEIGFPRLSTVSGQLLIDGNSRLTSLGNLDGLESVGMLEISWNSSLPQCLVDELDARLGACEPRSCEGNNTSATCE